MLDVTERKRKEGSKEGWMEGRKQARVDGWMEARKEGWMDRRKEREDRKGRDKSEERMDGWMDGKKEREDRKEKEVNLNTISTLNLRTVYSEDLIGDSVTLKVNSNINEIL